LWTSAGEEDLYFGSAGDFTLFTPEIHAVKSLLRARDGRLWIGTKAGLGVITDGQFRQLHPESTMAWGEPMFARLAEDADGVIWAGAGDGVLYRVAGERNYELIARRMLGAGNPSGRCCQMHEWRGVGGNVPRRVAAISRAGISLRYTTRDGLPDDVICQLLDDGEGRLVGRVEAGDFSRGQE
jgi:hypothetical protein